MNLGHTLRVSRSKAEPRKHWVGVRYQGPYVVLLLAPTSNISQATPIALTTVQAHKCGWELIRTADDCIRSSNDGVLWKGHQSTESVILTVNGQSIPLSASKARKIGAALLRKSDFADDFQLKTRKRNGYRTTL